jgi:hypothetical protein
MPTIAVASLRVTLHAPPHTVRPADSPSGYS